MKCEIERQLEILIFSHTPFFIPVTTGFQELTNPFPILTSLHAVLYILSSRRIQCKFHLLSSINYYVLHKYSTIHFMYFLYSQCEPTSHFFQQDNDRLKQGRITIEEFRAIYRILTHREEIVEIFNAYSENRKILLENNLVQFLTQEQYTTEMSKTIAFEIIQKYEPIEEGMFAFQSFISIFIVKYFFLFPKIILKQIIFMNYGYQITVFGWVKYLWENIFYRIDTFQNAILCNRGILSYTLFSSFFQLLPCISQVFRNELGGESKTTILLHLPYQKKVS